MCRSAMTRRDFGAISFVFRVLTNPVAGQLAPVIPFIEAVGAVPAQFHDRRHNRRDHGYQ